MSRRLRRLPVLVLVAVLAIGGAAPDVLARSPDELPLDGLFEVFPGDDSLAVQLDLAAPAGTQITEITVQVRGPSVDVVVFQETLAGPAVSWFGERGGLVPGSYDVIVRAEVSGNQQLLVGQAERTVEIGVADPLGGRPPPTARKPPRPPLGGGTISSTADGDVVVSRVETDVVVYGGTPSGVLAAVSAARGGASVALVEASNHIGGMMSSGLTATDYGHPVTIGGYTAEFFDRTQAAEGSAYGRWRFQPSTAEAAFLAMLREAGVSVHLGQRLAEHQGVAKQGTTITELRTTADVTFAGLIFIDASYEGDLMARAGVTYRVGREAPSAYGEARAGVRPSSLVFPAPQGIDPGFPVAAPAAVGSADERIQNSNYRLCFSTDADRVPFAAPPAYDPARYDIVAAHIDRRVSLGHAPDITWFLWPVALPNGKYDVNSNSYVSIGVPGANYGYPDGSRSTRADIEDWLADYTQGFLHFLSSDSRVPTAIRGQMATYGLCADEFTDNGNWPHLIYLREGRRMVGEYVLAESDVELRRTKADTIAVASYPIDAHHVSRWLDSNGGLRVEGGFWAGRPAATRWSIPYRSITPRAEEATNLFVTVAASSTHVAWAALRLEPQFMLMGEAAGTASGLLLRQRQGGVEFVVRTHALDVARLRSALRARGSVVDNYLFWDAVTTPFRGDIESTFLREVTFGCTAVNFCPSALTTREVMAAWLTRALDLPPASRDYFTDDEASPHEDSINRLAAAGITGGCDTNRFCPGASVTRGQMAAFLVRAFRLPTTTTDYFTDDATSIFRHDINRLAASGITAGCGGTRFCPHGLVTREQMSAFLWRAIR